MNELMQAVEAERVGPDQVALWWIGQAGYVLKTSGGKVVFIDAYLSGEVASPEEVEFGRMVEPPLAGADIRCDLYLCTHDHLDHADHETIQAIPGKESIRFVGPRNCARSFVKDGIPADRIVEVNVGDVTTVDGIQIRGTFCIPNDEDALDSAGFLITLENGITLYHSGDTGYTEFLYYLAKYPIDVMLVCVNGKYGNMNIHEAARLTRYLRPRRVIPNHYGMFARNTVDPYEFAGLLHATPADPPVNVMKLGEKLVYERS